MTYDAKLGARSVTIHAPGIGEFGPAEQAQLFTDFARAEYVVGLDVETTAHGKLGPMHRDFVVRTVQFGMPQSGWVLRLDDPEQRAAAETALRSPALRFCSHTRYDVLAVWREFGADISGRWTDTRMLARVADPSTFYRHLNRSVDLKALVSERFGPELAEYDRMLDDRFLELWVAAGNRRNAARAAWTAYGFTHIDLADDVFVLYAGLDAVACRLLYPELVRESQTPANLLGLETWLAGAMARMQMRGMTVDVERLDAIANEAGKACQAAEDALVELIGLTPRQGAKLREWFEADGVDFAAHGHPTTPAGAPKLDEDAVKAMQEYGLSATAAQVVETLLEYKARENEQAKAKEMLEHIAESFDGRLHPEVDPIGTITARMTSKAPNVQNYSKANPTMRATLLPDPGHVLIGADFDQVELRVAAALTGEQALVATILAGGDLHQLTADQIGCTRQEAKVVNFLLLYGGGGKALHAQIPDLPLDECYQFVNTYWDRYPAIDKYRNYLVGLGAEVRTLTGRRIPASESSWTGELDTRKYLNFLIQSVSRDLLVLAMHRLAQAGWGEALWAPIHDELILQVPEDRVAEGLAALESAMTMELLGVPITATAVALIDEDGVSRWMTIDRAEKVAAEKEAAIAA